MQPTDQGSTGSGVAFEDARLELARLRPHGDTDARLDGVRHATEICARTLGVERVSVWSLLSGGTELRCEVLYVLSEGAHHERGPRLCGTDYPAYFEALSSKKAIVAHDAVTDPVTAELVESYLRPHGITSMLDAPVFLDGEVVGVVCHEHIGEPRTWEQTEIDFASSVADMMSIIYEQARRIELEAENAVTAARNAERAHLEVLGRLARGVAHDFHNVLQPIRLAIDLQLEGGTVPDKIWAELLEAIDVGERLVKQLTGNDTVDSTGTCRADQVIAGLAPLLQRLVRAHASLELDLHAGQVQIPLPRSHFEQVLLNLVLNAADAIDAVEGTEPGTIRIATRLVGSQVVLEVTDDGVGMSENMRARAHELYVTNKPRGSGIGLATVHHLATRSGGDLAIDSAMGEGTRVRVTLPRVGP